MSKVIDSRVVEMSFDNSNFEKNVSTSMNTLEKLKAKLKGLDDTSVNLEQVGKAANDIDLNKLDTAIDNINKRFSTMGVIGTTVMQDLTKSALGLVKSFGSNLWSTTIGQIKSGGKARAQNIAQAKFTLEGMGFNFKEYEEDINHAVSGTAYGFDQAAQAASVFGSSGVKAGEEMKAALRGISGVAAMTGSSFEEIAYIFEKINGLGKVTNESLQMISGRGLNATATLAKALGKTEQEISEMARKGQIDFKTFAKAMDDAFGEHATDANKTLEGVTDNIRAQLSKIGQAFYDPLYQNESDLVKFFNSIYDKVKLLQKYTSPFAERLAKYVLKLARIGSKAIDSFDLERLAPLFENIIDIFDNLTNSVENFYTNVLSPFFREIKKAFYDVFPELDNGKSLIITLTDKLVDFTGKVRETSKHMGLLGKNGSIVRTVFRGVFTVIKGLITIFDILLNVLSKVGAVFTIVLATIANLVSNIGRLITSFMPNFKMIGINIAQGISYGILVGIPTLFKSIQAFFIAVVNGFQKLFIIHSPSAAMALLVGLPIALGIAAGIVLGIQPIRDTLATVFNTILADVANFKNTGIYKGIANIFGGLSNTTIALFDLLASALNKLAEAIRNLNATNIFEHIKDIERFFILGALTIIMLQLLKASTYFSAAMYNFMRAIKLYTFGRFNFWAKLPSLFQSITIAAIAISACIYALGKMDPNELYQGLTVLSIIFLGMAGVVLLAGAAQALFKRDFDVTAWKVIGVSFLGLAAAIAAITAAAYVLKDVPIGVTLGVFAGVYVLMGSMAGILVLASTLKSKSSLNGVKLIAGYVLAMSLLINAFAKMCIIAAIAPPEVMAQALSVMGMLSLMIIGVIGTLMLANKLITGNFGALYSKGSFAGIASAIISLAITMSILASLIKIIGKMDPNELDQGMWTIAGLMAIMSICISAMTLASSAGKGKSNKLLGAAASIAAMALLMKILSETIQAIGSMKQSDIDKAEDIIVRILALVVLISVATGLAATAVGVALAGLAAMVAAMAVSVYLIGSMEKGLFQGFAALIGILFLCGVVNGIISRLVPANYNPAYKMFLGIAGLVAACAAFVYVTGNMEWGDLLKGVLALGTLFIGLDVILRSMSQVNFNKFNRGTIKVFRQVARSIILIAATVALIGYALSKYTDDPYDALLVGMGAVGFALIGMWTIIQSLSVLNPKVVKHMDKMAKAVRSLSASILIIAGSLAVLSFIDNPTGLLAAAGAIIIVLGGMALVIAACRPLQNGKDIKYGAIVATTVAIGVISLAILTLSTLIADKDGWEKVSKAVLALVGCLVAIAGSLIAIQNNNVNFDDALSLLAGTAALLIAASAFGVLLDALGDRDWVALDAIATSMLLAIGSIVGAMIAISFSMSKLGAGYVAGSTAVLFALCLELAMVANVLTGLVGYDWEVIKAGLIQIRNALITLGIIVGVLAAIIGATGTTGFLALAGALGILAIAMWEFSSVASIMDTVANSMTRFSDEFTSLFNRKTAEEASEAIKMMLGGLADGITELAEAIKKNGPLATFAAIAVMNSVVTESKKALKVSSPSEEFSDIGYWVIRGFVDGLIKTSKNPNFGIFTTVKKVFGTFIEAVRNILQTHSDSVEFMNIAFDCVHGFFSGIMNNLQFVYNPAKAMGTTIMSGLKAGLSELFGGDFQQQFNGAIGNLFGGSGGGFSQLISGYDFSNFNSEDFINKMLEGNLTMDSLSADGIEQLTKSLREAGYEGDELTEKLKELGFSAEDIKAQGLDVSNLLGTEEAKNGVSAVSEEVKKLSDRILKGEFGNAPKRWDKMFEDAIKNGKTAEQAYADIADAQNEVNRSKGVKKTWDAAMIEKNVSEAVKKANAEKIKSNEEAAKADQKAKEEAEKASKDYYKMTESERRKRENAQKRIGTYQKEHPNPKPATTAPATTSSTTATTKPIAETTGQLTFLEKAAGAVVQITDKITNNAWGSKQAYGETAKAADTQTQAVKETNNELKEEVKLTDTISSGFQKSAENANKQTEEVKKQADVNKSIAQTVEESAKATDKTNDLNKSISQTVEDSAKATEKAADVNKTIAQVTEESAKASGESANANKTLTQIAEENAKATKEVSDETDKQSMTLTELVEIQNDQKSTVEETIEAQNKQTEAVKKTVEASEKALEINKEALKMTDSERRKRELASKRNSSSVNKTAYKKEIESLYSTSIGAIKDKDSTEKEAYKREIEKLYSTQISASKSDTDSTVQAHKKAVEELYSTQISAINEESDINKEAYKRSIEALQDAQISEKDIDIDGKTLIEGVTKPTNQAGMVLASLFGRQVSMAMDAYFSERFVPLEFSQKRRKQKKSAEDFYLEDQALRDIENQFIRKNKNRQFESATDFTLNKYYSWEVGRMDAFAQQKADRLGKEAALRKQQKILLQVDMDPEYEFTMDDKKSIEKAYNDAYNDYLDSVWNNQLHQYGFTTLGDSVNPVYAVRFKMEMEKDEDWNAAIAYENKVKNESYQEYGKLLGKQVGDAIEDGVEESAKKFPKVVEESVTKAVDEQADGIGKEIGSRVSDSITSTNPDLKDYGDKIGKETEKVVTEGIKNQSENIGNMAANTVTSSINKAADTKGKEITSGLRNEVSEGLQTELKPVAKMLGEDTVESFSDGFSSKAIPDVKYRYPADQASSALGSKEVISNFEKDAKDSVTEYANGFIADNIPDAKFKMPADKATSVLKSKEVRSGLYSAGENGTLGFADGTLSPRSKMAVENAGTQIANLYKDSLEKNLDMHSPSVVMYEDGINTVMGFVNGILSMFTTVEDAGVKIGNAALNVITPVVTGIQNAVNQGLDLTPIITPVIDSTTVQNDINGINELLGQQHIASITENFRATQEFKSQEILDMQTRMGTMQDTIDMLTAAILNQPTPEVNANVILQGEAAGIFRSVQQSNNQYQKMHGRSAFA